MAKEKKSAELLKEFSIWYDGYVPETSHQKYYISISDDGNCRESIGKGGNPMDILYTDNRVKASKAFHKYAEYLAAVLEEQQASKAEYFEAFRLLHAMKHGVRKAWMEDIQMPFDIEEEDQFSSSMKYDEGRNLFVFSRLGENNISFMEMLRVLNEKCSPYGERYLEDRTRFFFQDIQGDVFSRIDAFKKGSRSLEEQAKLFWLVKKARKAPWSALVKSALEEAEKSLLED